METLGLCSFPAMFDAMSPVVATGFPLALVAVLTGVTEKNEPHLARRSFKWTPAVAASESLLKAASCFSSRLRAGFCQKTLFRSFEHLMSQAIAFLFR